MLPAPANPVVYIFFPHLINSRNDRDLAEACTFVWASSLFSNKARLFIIWSNQSKNWCQATRDTRSRSLWSMSSCIWTLWKIPHSVHCLSQTRVLFAQPYIFRTAVQSERDRVHGDRAVQGANVLRTYQGREQQEPLENSQARGDAIILRELLHLCRLCRCGISTIAY